MEPSIFETAANFLGIPSALLELGAVGVLLVVVAWLVRLLWEKEKQDVSRTNLDVKQTDLIAQGFTLLGETLKGLNDLQAAIKENTEALTNAFKGLTVTITDQVSPIKDGLEEIRKELLSNKETKIVIKDASGKIIAIVHAKPVTDNSGETVIEVQYALQTENNQ